MAEVPRWRRNLARRRARDAKERERWYANLDELGRAHGKAAPGRVFSVAGLALLLLCVLLAYGLFRLLGVVF